MSHCAPTVCAQVPVLATNWAIHSARNQVCRSGAQADGTAAPEGRGRGVPAYVDVVDHPGASPPGPHPAPSGSRGPLS